MTDALSAAIESILRSDDLSEEIHQAQINTLREAYEAALAQAQEPCNKSCAPGYCYCAAQEAQPAQDTDCQAQGICQRSGYSIK